MKLNIEIDNLTEAESLAIQDFLSTWLLANVNVSQYSKTRKPESAWMSKHYQVEADLSLS